MIRTKSSSTLVLGEFIGAGGFAKVYKTTFAENENAAAKVFERDNSMALKEFSVARNLRHDNIVRVISVLRSCTDESSALIMELVDGMDLGALIYEQGAPLVEATIWPIVSQMAAGLAYMHDSDVLHRDMKPQNVLLTFDLNVKLTDFGLSVSVANSPNKECDLTGGTVPYMAPERISKRPHSFPSDIWSLGCIIYEMATCRHPFGEDEVAILNGDYEAIKNRSADVSSLVKEILLPLATMRPTAHKVREFAKRMCEDFREGASKSGTGTAE